MTDWPKDVLIIDDPIKAGVADSWRPGLIALARRKFADGIKLTASEAELIAVSDRLTRAITAVAVGAGVVGSSAAKLREILLGDAIGREVLNARHREQLSGATERVSAAAKESLARYLRGSERPGAELERIMNTPQKLPTFTGVVGNRKQRRAQAKKQRKAGRR